MYKYAETFHANKGANWQSSFLYQLCCFQNGNLWYTFQLLFTRKCCLLFTWKRITSILFFIWLEKMGTFLVPEVRFFPTGPLFRRSAFSQTQGLAPGRFLDDAMKIRALLLPFLQALKKNEFIHCFILNLKYVYLDSFHLLRKCSD